MTNDATGRPDGQDTRPTPIPPTGPHGGYEAPPPSVADAMSTAPHATAAGTTTGTATATLAPEPPVDRAGDPRGINTAGVVVGLFCLIVAALVVVREQLDWQINWEEYGPAGLIGLGAVLVLLGGIGLARRRDR